MSVLQYKPMGQNLPLKTGLQGEGVQEFINTRLNLYLIHVGH